MSKLHSDIIRQTQKMVNTAQLLLQENEQHELDIKLVLELQMDVLKDLLNEIKTGE